MPVCRCTSGSLRHLVSGCSVLTGVPAPPRGLQSAEALPASWGHRSGTPAAAPGEQAPVCSPLSRSGPESTHMLVQCHALAMCAAHTVMKSTQPQLREFALHRKGRNVPTHN